MSGNDESELGKAINSLKQNLSDFSQGLQEGYQKQDKSIKESNKEEKILAGLASGVIEGLANPVRMIFALFR